MTRAIYTLAFCLLALTPAAHAQGDEECASRENVVAYLTGEEYGETLQSMGLNTNGVVELYANPETGTWTIIVTSPEGVTCPVGAGESWQNVAPLEPQGDPA